MIEEIIPPVPVELLEKELSSDTFLRYSNKCHNQIHVVDAKTAPNVMREIGRLREYSFRDAGGGTGKSCDIDEYDLMEPPCHQLIVWDPQEKLILGGYRFIYGADIAVENGEPRIATSHLFNFSDRFLKDYLPHTLELGRSFVRLEYQSSRAGAKAIFALDNLWDGLGALTVLNPDIRYLFGKVTMYPSYWKEGRDMILNFLANHFPDRENLVYPKDQYAIKPIANQTAFSGDFKEDYRNLNSVLRANNVNIPPLVNAYMSLSPTMKVFGTAVNDTFGDVEETGILIAIDDIFEEKKRRHIETYDQQEHI